MKLIPQKRVMNQARFSSEVVFQLARLTFESGRPLDREAARFFRANKRLGASDRRFISETLFSLFRWWGWIRRLSKSEERLWGREVEKIGSSKEWISMLLAANLLDSIELHPIAAHWKETLGKTFKFPGYIEGLADKKLEEQGQELSRLFRIPLTHWNDLVPHWIGEEIQLSRKDFRSLVGCFQRRSPMWLRAQTGDCRKLINDLELAGLLVQRSPHLEDALNVSNPRRNLYELDAFREGRFEIQDLASQVIGEVCDPQPGERWWDVCAGAGGKSLQIASKMENKGTVVATDIRSWKLKDLRKRAKRARYSNIAIRDRNGAKIPARSSNFDGVLVDAPCSGIGTWRRNPDARWTLQRDELTSLVEMQLEILKTASKAVKPGGCLVYATCSLCFRENEEVVNEFMSDACDYSLESIKHPLTKVTVKGMVNVWPGMADSDGVFVCKLRRR